MRAIWTGAINFGLINIPVKLMTATKKKNIKFRNLHKECNTPVKMKRYCPRCEKEVDYDELVKGYEYEDDKFVILQDEDFDNIPVKSTSSIDIVDFVKLEEIDPVYYIKTYYLKPAEGGEKPYYLLNRAMKETEKVAISRITIRTRESLAVVRALGDEVLALETMFFAEEVRPKANLNLEDLENKIEIQSSEEKMARDLINNLTSSFEPEKYSNKYREKLLEILRNKIEGQDVETVEQAPKDAKVLDLMEKLKASVEATENERENEDEQQKEAIN